MLSLSRKDDMADLSDALLFKAEKKLVMEEKGNGSSMSRSALGELANTTFNSHQEHCPHLVFDADHTNVQSDYIPLTHCWLSPLSSVPRLLLRVLSCASEKVKSLSHVRLFATPWTVAHQAPPSMGFSRQEYWSGLPFPSPGDLPDPGIESRSPTL